MSVFSKYFHKFDKRDSYYITRKRDLHSVINFAYKFLLLFSAIFILFFVLFIVNILWEGSQIIIKKYGFSNIFQDKWLAGTTASNFGFMPFIEGTLVTSIYAIIIAVPLSIGISLFISQYISNKYVKNSLRFFIEIIAAIPSVLIGFWGIKLMGPSLQNFHFVIDLPLLSGFHYTLSLPFLSPIQINFPLTFDFSLYNFLLSFNFYIPVPFFGTIHLFIPYITEPTGGIKSYLNVFTAVIALVIMITPIIVSITVSIMNQVPVIQKEAALALGATPWEMSRMTVIPQSMRGTIGAITLGFGRAFGETMAVTMLIGNGIGTFTSLFQGGSSMTAIWANEWGIDVAVGPSRSALLELALLLLILSLIINILARLIVKGTFSTGTGRMEG